MDEPIIRSGNVINTILNRVSENIDLLIKLSVMVGIFILSAIIGYMVGYIASVILRRLLLREKVQEVLIKYGATTSNLWKSIVNFLSTCSLLLVGSAVITGIFILIGEPIFNEVFLFVWNTYLFILFVIMGYLISGVSCKFVKDVLSSINFEEELKKYKVSESFGGIPISTIIATVVKWYVFVIVVTFIILEITTMGSLADKNFVLYRIMNLLYDYIPNALLGFVVLSISLISANFVGNKIKSYKLVFSDTIALGVEIAIIFFGIVLALPHFGIKNVQILEYSFLLLMGGISLGLAIAIGLGLKESVAHISRRYEKKIK
ncbi:MAG: hypothetical protein DRO90_00525 [Candidatus Altiarchaeales archaeon]|nr:MAG: hypothetical protein DRO90_00525 [Candidatus Altiarchaeales archaeon]